MEMGIMFTPKKYGGQEEHVKCEYLITDYKYLTQAV